MEQAEVDDLDDAQHAIATATGQIPKSALPIVHTDFELRVPVTVKGWKAAEILKTKYSDAEANRMTDDEVAMAISEYFVALADQPVKVDTSAMYRRVVQFAEAKSGGPVGALLDRWPGDQQ